MAVPGYAARRARLIRQLKGLEVDCLLISGSTNVRYLTGFTGDSTWLFVSPSETVLISDTRFETQLAEECPGVSVSIRDAGKSMNASVADIVQATRCRAVGVEADDLTVSQHQGLVRQLSGSTVVNTTGSVEGLREIKDKWELEQIREAIRIAERGIGVLRSMLRPDVTERQLRFILEDAMRSFGGCGTAFEPIVGVGPTGAMPHAHAGNRLVSESPALLVDWGAMTWTGYRSDLTRVFFTGKPTKQMQQVYDVVLTAQHAAIAAIKPGVSCRAVDQIARKIIEDAGFGRFFGHSLGHGIGLDIHEAVRVGPTSDREFQPGMVVTVEPGIYLPGKFGVRIEDDVLVTAAGNEVLTSVPREIGQSIVEFLA
jgi:Xaa-Pro aminopeptidase